MKQKSILENKKNEVIDGVEYVTATAEDKEKLKETIFSVYRSLYKNIDRKEFNNVIYKNKVLNSDDVHNYMGERITEDFVVKPLLRALNYNEEFKYRPIFGISENTRKVGDLIIHGEYSDEDLKILIETEPLNKRWKMIDVTHDIKISLPNQKFSYTTKNLSGIEQVYTWLNYRDNCGKYGLATNGFVWQKMMLKQIWNEKKGRCSEYIKIFKAINLKYIFMKIDSDDGFSKIPEKEMKEIDKKLGEFYDSFSKDLIIYSFEGKIKGKYMPPSQKKTH